MDDLRESPALEITARAAAAKLGRITAVEPHIRALPEHLAKLGVGFATDPREAIAQADVVALLVDHRAFKTLDRALLNGKAIVDTRGVWR